MENEFEIDSDNDAVRVTLTVKSGRATRNVLLTMILLVAAALVTILFITDKSEIFYLVLVVGAIGVGLPLRYYLWNRYGQEYFMVTTTHLTYRYNYGILKTRWITLPFDQLGLGYRSVMDGTKNLEEKGQLTFHDHDEKKQVSYEFHRTAVLLDRSEINEIDQEIRKLFDANGSGDTVFVGFTIDDD